MNCPRCGGILENGDRFCSWCGFSLPAVPDVQPAPAPAPPAPAPAPYAQPVPAPAPSPAPYVQPQVSPEPKPYGIEQNTSVQYPRVEIIPKKKLSAACIIGFAVAVFSLVIFITAFTWSSIDHSSSVSTVLGFTFFISLFLFMVSMAFSIAGLIIARKKKKKGWGFALAGLIISSLGIAGAIVFIILIGIIAGAVIAIFGSAMEGRYTGDTVVKDDYKVVMRSDSDESDAMAITWYWDGNPDHNTIKPGTVGDGTVITSLGGPPSGFMGGMYYFDIQPSDDLTNYMDTSSFRSSQAYNGWFSREETPEYFGIYEDVTVTFEDLVFYVDLGEDVGNVLMSIDYNSYLSYIGIKNDDGSYSIYHYCFYFTCDKDNPAYYAKDGVLYSRETGEKVTGMHIYDGSPLNYARFDPGRVIPPTGSSSSGGDDLLSYGNGSEHISLWTYSMDVPLIVRQYMEINPAFAEQYTVDFTIIETNGGKYRDRLDQALVSGGSTSPDIYVVDSEFAYKYTQGDFAPYAAAYEDLGIDVDNKVSEAEIAPYVLDMGTYNGKIVGLSYESASGAMIYRASIAREVFGTDDPEEIEEIIGAGSGSWTKFLEAAEELGNEGYHIVSTTDDLWNVVKEDSSRPWIEDGELVIAPETDDYMDISKILVDNDWTSDGIGWTADWYSDMSGATEQNAFCFFGPSWFFEYILKFNAGGDFESGQGTYGDWRICRPPVGFSWGGTWLLANRYTDNPDGVAELLEWMTLDCSETGCQYLHANGKLINNAQCAVPSNTVMRMIDWDSDCCGGQQLASVFADCNSYASCKNLTPYDEQIDGYWNDAVDSYVSGYEDRDEAINDFKQNVYDNIAF